MSKKAQERLFQIIMSIYVSAIIIVLKMVISLHIPRFNINFCEGVYEDILFGLLSTFITQTIILLCKRRAKKYKSAATSNPKDYLFYLIGSVITFDIALALNILSNYLYFIPIVGLIIVNLFWLICNILLYVFIIKNNYIRRNQNNAI